MRDSNSLKDEIQSLITKEFTKDAFVIGYFLDQVTIGLFKNGKLIFAEKPTPVDFTVLDYLIVFNPEKEQRIIKNGDCVTDKIILDSDSFTEENMLLYGCDGGKVIDIDDNFLIIQDRQKVIALPNINHLKEKPDYIHPLVLVVHNFVTQTEDGICYLNQGRYVNIKEED